MRPGRSIPRREEGRSNKKLIAFARRTLKGGAAKGGRKPTCAECYQLFQAGVKKQFPCEECQGDLAPENVPVWECFTRCGSKSEYGAGASRTSSFSIDWEAARLWMDLHPQADGSDVFEKIVALVKDLNT